ncbi:MAG: 1-acyl-sn-glycerol-3-phosphate acyltransferase [Bacteroidales bacterium]|jgi:1-acyl-sn-glycerol-3-phosphate acyltransferase|nr:1-acyl-sn-glycerol-3-phosphate acyltransferase [Bacteroidales bacterium]
MFISVDNLFKDKNPKLHRKIPHFVIRWIERIIHQDEVNEFMEINHNSTGLEFSNNVIKRLNLTVKVIGEENIPKAGRCLVASNHPLGGPDGIALISVIGQYRKDIKFPVNDLLMQLYPMQDIFVPINKFGRHNQNVVKELNDVFASEDAVLYFPAGICSRKQKGVIKDLEWKKTIISKAKEYQRDIVPVYFGGQNTNRFYRIANWRKRLGIKTNIEMFFLPDETFRQYGKEIFIIFGTPISCSFFDSSKNEKEWAQWLKEQVYQLKDNI